MRVKIRKLSNKFEIGIVSSTNVHFNNAQT